MKYSRILRVGICLLLVFSLLIGVSPIGAQATSVGVAVTAVVGSIAAVAVVALTFQALGVMPDRGNTSVFNDTVNACVDALTKAGVFIGGMVSVMQVTNNAVVKNYVNQSIVQAILDWLFVNNVVESNSLHNWGDEFEVTIDSTTYTYASNSPDSQSIIPVVFTYINPSATVNMYHFVFGMFSTNKGIRLNGQYHTTSRMVGDYYFYSARTMSENSIAEFKEHSYSGYIDLGFHTVDTSSITLYDYMATLDLAALLGTYGVATGLVAGQIGTDVETDYETWVDDGIIAVDFGIGYVDDPNTDLDNEDDDDSDTEIGPTLPPGELNPPSPDNPVSPSLNPPPWWKNNKWLNIGAGALGWELGNITNSLLDQSQTDVQTGVADPSYKPDSSLFGNAGNGNNTVVDPDPPNSDPSEPPSSDPFEDYLSKKVNALCTEFVFVDSIVKTAQALHTGLAGVTTEPPVIYIDLGAAQGFHDIGGKVPFLDLQWYATYKPTVDTMISAFLWICFIWHMMLKLPGIISGMPGDFVMAGAEHLGVDAYLPDRSLSREMTRREIRSSVRRRIK